MSVYVMCVWLCSVVCVCMYVHVMCVCGVCLWCVCTHMCMYMLVRRDVCAWPEEITGGLLCHSPPIPQKQQLSLSLEFTFLGSVGSLQVQVTCLCLHQRCNCRSLGDNGFLYEHCSQSLILETVQQAFSTTEPFIQPLFLFSFLFWGTSSGSAVIV